MPRRIRGSWHVDTRVLQPNGKLKRTLRKARINSKFGATAEEHALHTRSFEAPGAKPTLFSELAKRYFLAHVAAANGLAEQQGKRQTFDAHLLPVFGEMSLEAITSEVLSAYVGAKLKSDYSPKSINNHLTMVRSALACAVEWGLLARLPRIPWAKVPEQKFDWFTFDEADRLLAADVREPFALMIHAAIRTGLRIGELLALQWQHIDLVRGVIRVERAVSVGVEKAPKNGRHRTIPIAPKLLAALKAYKQLRAGYVFGSGETRLRRNETRRPLWNACAKAGLRQVGWHVLRHTFASHLVSRGVPLNTVRELLGHSTIAMTLRYAHLAPAAAAAAVALLEAPGSGEEASGEVSATNQQKNGGGAGNRT